MRTNQKGDGRALFVTLRQQRNHAARRHTCQPRGKGQMVSSRPSSSTRGGVPEILLLLLRQLPPLAARLESKFGLAATGRDCPGRTRCGWHSQGFDPYCIPLNAYQNGLSVAVDVSGHNANAVSLAAGMHRLLPERGFYSSSAHPAEQTGGCRSPSGSRFVPFYPFSAIRSLVSRSKAGL